MYNPPIMRTRLVVFAMAMCGAGVVLGQQAPAPAPSPTPTVEILDPAFEALIDRNAQVTRVATGFNRWVEGPVWTTWNTLLFAEIPSNNIVQYKPREGTSVYLTPSG